MCTFIDAMVPHKMQTKSQQKATPTILDLVHHWITSHPLAILYRQKVLSYLHMTKYMP